MGTDADRAGTVRSGFSAGRFVGDTTSPKAVTHEIRAGEDGLNVRFWGVRGSVPVSGESCWRYGGNTTCVQVCIPGDSRIVVFDMGSGARPLGLKLEKIDKEIQGLVFFTHVHWDHIHGIPFFKPFFRSGNRFELFAPVQNSDSARSLLFGQMSAPHFPVSANTFGAELNVRNLQSDAVDFGFFRLSHMRANHHSNTVIYKLEAQGRTLIFAPDNEVQIDDSTGITGESTEMPGSANATLLVPDLLRGIKPSGLREFIWGADLLIHDGQYDRADYEGKKNWGHSAWETVLELALECKVRQLILTHHDPEASDEMLASREMNLRLKTASSSLKTGLAREGMELTLASGIDQK